MKHFPLILTVIFALAFGYTGNYWLLGLCAGAWIVTVYRWIKRDAGAI